MKKYIAKLDRESISLDYGYKLAVIKNGAEYFESEITQRFPQFFVASGEELLLDNTSKVEVKVVEEVVVAPVVEEVIVETAPVVEAPKVDLNKKKK